jgi:cytochrome c-type biogenesis protein CcmH/NrfF
MLVSTRRRNKQPIGRPASSAGRHLTGLRLRRCLKGRRFPQIMRMLRRCFVCQAQQYVESHAEPHKQC